MLVEFCVITEIGTTLRGMRGQEHWARYNEYLYEIGEIIVVDHTGREFGGRMRKPSKWDVRCEYFEDVTAAVLRSQAIMEAIDAE